MTLGEAVHFLYVLMRNFVNVRMTVLTFDLGVDAHAKSAFVNKQQSECSIFVNTTQARIFMTHQAIAHISGDAFYCRAEKKQPNSKPSMREIEKTSWFEHLDPVLHHCWRQTRFVLQVEILGEHEHREVVIANDMPSYGWRIADLPVVLSND